MKYREARKALLDAKCKWAEGKGDHEKWYCPCGNHMAVITTGRKVKAGVIGDVISKLSCLPEGWLQ